MNEGTHIKPKMSGLEASWHEAMAGHRAADAARDQGANPAAVAAVATATAGPVNLGGYLIHPASQGTVWTLQRAARMFAQWADARGMSASDDPANLGTREMLELGLTTLIFSDARGCWRAMDAGGFPAMLEQAESIMWEMPLAESLALRSHFEKEMRTIQSLAGDEEAAVPEKKRMADGASPAIPTPPPAQAWPRSNGSPPNTVSPLPMPFGAPL